MCLISWCAGAKAPAVIGFVGVDLVGAKDTGFPSGKPVHEDVVGRLPVANPKDV